MTSPSADDWGRSYFRWLEGFAAFRDGDPRRARSLSQDTWQVALELGDQNMASWSMYLVALSLASSGDRHRAALIHGHLRAAGSPMLLAVLERELPVKGLATGSWDEASLAQGGRMTSDELAAMVTAGPGQPPSGPTGPDVLSPREVEVALLIGQGLSNQEIAARLVISKRTAEGHAQRVFAKLGLDRNQLTAWAAERYGRGTD
jgi:non-specific serine/threonine protein kinase